MDNSLVRAKIVFERTFVPGLNPCCNGRWSRTYDSVCFRKSGVQVLILIVVEDGLVLSEVVMQDGNHLLS